MSEKCEPDLKDLEYRLRGAQAQYRFMEGRQQAWQDAAAYVLEKAAEAWKREDDQDARKLRALAALVADRSRDEAREVEAASREFAEAEAAYAAASDSEAE